MTGQPAFPQRTDPDLIRAEDTTFENERRHESHPVNGDPPTPRIFAQAGEDIRAGDALVVGQDGRIRRLNAEQIIAGREPSASLTIAATGTKGNAMERLGALYDALYDHELLSTPDPHWQQTGPRVKDAFCAAFLAAFPGTTRASSSYEEDYLAAERGRQEELARKVGFLETVLDGITQKAEQGLHSPASGKVHSLYDIRESANAALQRPKVGTRVKRLVPPRGDQGTVIGWNAELNAPLIEWDSERGLPPEACEPHEYTTDLNEEAQR
jgi:hypothetical protein